MLEITKENYEQIKQQLEEYENRKIDDWPLSVEDLPDLGQFWIAPFNGEINLSNEDASSISDYETEIDAKSALAFAQLSRLIRHINKGWQPDWNDTDEYKFSVHSDTINQSLRKDWLKRNPDYPSCLHFKNEEDRDRSMVDHKHLWLDYFQITKK